MTIVIRANYGDESIALIQWLHENPQKNRTVMVCYIDTGWASAEWPKRVLEAEQLAKRYGFTPIRIQSPITFEDLIIQRGDFPSPKFQWCAGFLKGVPFIDWLDKQDPKGEYIIAMAKRQAAYRVTILPQIEACEHHGDRTVWHPMLEVSHQARDELLERAGFKPQYARSQECEPCVNARESDLARLSSVDREKLKRLELKIKKNLFIQGAQVNASRSTSRDDFTMGCGDPFGCGL